MEEDTARNTHTLGGGQSGVDFNRSGIPLLEIVTEPDLRSAQEVYVFLTTLKQILEYLDVSDCNMEEGSLRAEANISIRPKGVTALGVKTEVKNVASFSGVTKAIDYEIARQIQVLEGGGKVVQETRGWDAEREVTFTQRHKESAHDYRYFPEPDLVPVAVDETWERRIRETLPELPPARRKRLIAEHGLSEYDAAVITATRALADYYEQTVAAGADAKKAANWIMGDLQMLMTGAGQGIIACKVSPANLAGMIKLIEDGTISGKIAKEVLMDMFASGKTPQAIVAEKGLVQISDAAALEEAVRKVLAANPDQVEQYRAGKEKVLGFLMGQVMRATRGKANPSLVNEIMVRQLRA